jgi:iron complex transport system substrate-binding protein
MSTRPAVRTWLAVMALMARWVLLSSPGWAQAAAVSLTDDRGVRVSLPAPPQRIVSLLPSLTETVCALGACARLVGTDRYSNFPEAARQVAKVGGLDDANVEAIVALRPDVVLLAVSSRVTERLEGLGVKVLALEPRTFDDVQRVAAKLSQLLGQGAAGEHLWLTMVAQINEAARQVPPSLRGLSVYDEVDSAPYAAGADSFIGQVLSRLGLRNIVPAGMGPFPKLNPEYVVRADPALILVAARSAPGLANRPGWGHIQAVKAGRVCAFSPEQGDVLARPGPRLGEAAWVIVGCLRGLAGSTTGAHGVPGDAAASSASRSPRP